MEFRDLVYWGGLTARAREDQRALRHTVRPAVIKIAPGHLAPGSRGIAAGKRSLLDESDTPQLNERLIYVFFR